jgi:predicted DsbA family dithiol-disulfide isomerase
MTHIKILGTNCPSCKTTFENALQIERDMQGSVKVEKISDIEKIMQYDVLSIPVLLINEKIKIVGRAVSYSEMKTLINEEKTSNQLNQ